ncbi:LiaF transmembrane domain-containing protein [Roseateles koreensis]|uniref:LiaF transmembrane domain-containing protein n=1 Tax=Roseateles koreensis TaxID=2987526 RepID=A0ABT5KU85_9BURK|nr:hypothetical protein [Roseateles koreensis]MDC8785918.1 hypothetical protein [Roseateles koreensis]
MGLCLIVIGTVALLEQRGYQLIDWLWAHWPLALTAVGMVRLLTARGLGQVGNGVFLILLSGWLYACEAAYWGMSYTNSWPVLLVGLGLWKLLLGGLSLRQEHAQVTAHEQGTAQGMTQGMTQGIGKGEGQA